jgi:curved DNA-binding protein
VEFKDYYQVLGVPRDATADQIKQAFRRLARKYHPDVSKEPDAAARMSAVNEANAVLSDPERRAAYDSIGQGRRPGEPFTPPPDWDAGFEFSGPGPGFEFGDGTGEAADFSDFFAELFGRAGARGRRRSGPGGGASARGDDHHARVLLELEDAMRGAVRQVTLRSPQTDASGRPVLRERTLDVKIPAGVRPGQLIRLAGQGGEGHGGAPAGDLFLEVRLRPHPRFEVDGANLVGELPVAPWEAALGAVVPVELPDGSTLRLRVPQGAQGGRMLTVRGRGLPGQPPGDLELALRIVLPEADDPKARRLYETMARELAGFDARAAARAQDTDGRRS